MSIRVRLASSSPTTQEDETMTIYTAPARVDSSGIVTGLGALIKEPATRLKLYGYSVIAALGVYVASDVRDAVVQSIAAGNDLVKVSIDGALAGIGLVVVPLGMLAMANIAPTEKS